jgi:O-methyltransferase involved in polyketide biosynthesis
MASEGARISPTAHYTSYVWVRNGLSPEALASPTGRRLYKLFRPIDRAYELAGRTLGLEKSLLARHRKIDAGLEAAIASGAVGQVVELAAGLSGRGLRITDAHPEVGYLEADLPAMAEAKRARLDRAGLLRDGHRIEAVDAFAADGPGSLEALFASLDAQRGCAVITEGLLSYYPQPAVETLWRRIASGLARFPRGLYLADLVIVGALPAAPAYYLFTGVLQTLVRGRMHRQGASDDEAAAALEACGFARVVVHPEPGSVEHVAEAWVGA